MPTPSGKRNRATVPALSKRPLPRAANSNLALNGIIEKIGNSSGVGDSYSRGSLHINDPKTGQEVRLEWENGFPERWWQGLYRVISIKLKATINGRVRL
jgi:hypothetical protein